MWHEWELLDRATGEHVDGGETRDGRLAAEQTAQSSMADFENAYGDSACINGMVVRRFAFQVYEMWPDLLDVMES